MHWHWQPRLIGIFTVPLFTDKICLLLGCGYLNHGNIDLDEKFNTSRVCFGASRPVGLGSFIASSFDSSAAFQQSVQIW